MSVITEIDNKCRICLNQNQGNISIYNNAYPESRLRDNVCIFGDIEVRKDDIFPKYLCQSCFSALQVAIHFRRTAKETDRLLKLKSQSLNSKNLQVILNGSRCAKSEKQIVILQNYSQTQLKKENLEQGQIPDRNGKLIISCSEQEQMQSTAVDDIKKGFNTEEDVQTTGDIQSVFETDEFVSKVDKKEGSMQYVRKEHIFNGPHITKMNKIKNQQEQNLGAVKSEVLSTFPVSPKTPYKSGKAFKQKLEYNLVNFKITTMETKFQCEVCNKYFRERNACEEHRKLVHSIVIDISSCSSSNASQISSEKSNVHDLCPRTFKHKHSLLTHKLIHEGNGPLVAYAKHFKFIGLIQDKLMVQCQICYRTMQKQSMHQHYKTLHEPNLPRSLHLCDVCGKQVNSHANLVNHKTIHTRDFLFKCKMCPYKGRNYGLLRTHMSTHSEKYLTCDLCSKQIRLRSNLIRHIRRHYKPKYKCKLCTRQFYEKSAQDLHFKIKHIDGNKPIPCELCEKMYSCRKNLLKHQNKVHDRKKIGFGHSAHYKAAEQNR